MEFIDLQFIDLQAQYRQHQKQIDASMQKVLQHGQFIKGPEITSLEEKLAKYVHVKHCIAMSSGTTALHVALMALDIQPGDEIITTPFSFFAIAEVIFLLGAKPVYVDIDPRTYNINPQLIESVITDKTKAIMPVSLYGQCADFDVINAIAKKYHIPVIEDAAQSFGATYKGRKSCGHTEIACTSFFPSKPLGCYGDGGACFTNDDELAHRMRLIIDHGQASRYHHVTLGINARFSSIQAAVLLTKMEFFDQEMKQRAQAARWYEEAFADSKDEIQIPYIEPHNVSAYAQYTIQVDNRENLRQALASQGIPTAIHYPKGLHEQPLMLEKYPEAKTMHFPVTEAATHRVLSLPFHPYLTKDQIEKVVEAIAKNLSWIS